MSDQVRSAPAVDFHETSIPSLVRYYRGQFATDLAMQLAYRGSLVIWCLGFIVQPIVFIVIWQAVAASRGGEGMTAGQYAAYFSVQMLVNHLTFIWHMWEFEWRIRSGYFSPILLRPIHPIHNDISQNLSYKVVGLVGIIPAMFIVAWMFDADFSATRPLDVAAFALALPLAMILRFTLEWSLACAAFWLTKVSALNQFVDVFFLYLAGQFAPLDDMPRVIQQASFVLPFRWCVAFPIEVITGKHSGGELLVGFAMQLAWIAIAIVVLRAVWSRAVRKYGAVGA